MHFPLKDSLYITDQLNHDRIICRWRGQHSYCVVLASWGTVPTLSVLWFLLPAGPPWAAPLKTNHTGGTKTCLNRGCIHQSVDIIYHVILSLKYTSDLPCSVCLVFFFCKGKIQPSFIPFYSSLIKKREKKHCLDFCSSKMWTLTSVDTMSCCKYISCQMKHTSQTALLKHPPFISGNFLYFSVWTLEICCARCQ